MKTQIEITENNGIEIPKELVKLALKVIAESNNFTGKTIIKMGSASSKSTKENAQKWLNWLRENKIEFLQINDYEVWDLFAGLIND